MPSTEPALIEISHCSLILDDHTILDDISFALRRGERWVLIGANGSGKTFLLKMLRGDVWPTPTGRERRRYGFGSSVSDEPRDLKHNMAYVGPERQDKYARHDWNLTVTQVVTTGLFDEDIPLTRPSRAQRERVARVLRRFSLWGLRGRRLLTLSYGQRRLALVARAYASPATVLLLDEVFNGLDEGSKKKLRRALERPRGGHDWVLTSHRPKELPANVTHMARIVSGRLVSAGPVGAAGAAPNPDMPDQKTRGSAAAASPLLAVDRKRSGPLTSMHDDCADKAAGGMRGDAPTAQAPRGDWLVRIRQADIYRDFRPVIRALDWTLHRGEHWAVLGANGSGKSTLLSLIYGDLHPALGGTIERRGCPRGTPIARWKERTGWVSPELQAAHHAAHSLEEVVISGRYSSVGLNVLPGAQDRRAALYWMRLFGIDDLRHRGPRQVSYGQMRLALLARAIVNRPRLLLLDEPCTGLDGEVRARIMSFIETVARGGTQVIMAVHDPEDIVPAIRNLLKIGRGGHAHAVLLPQSGVLGQVPSVGPLSQPQVRRRLRPRR